MWFRFPEGVTELSCQLQTFKPEVKDEKGVNYFRAPAHFSSIILGLGGFSIAQPPEGAPADLPLPDPLRDGAIVDLSHEVTRLRQELAEARQGEQAAIGAVSSLKHERDGLLQTVQALEAKLAGLEEDDDEPAVLETPKPGVNVAPAAAAVKKA